MTTLAHYPYKSPSCHGLSGVTTDLNIPRPTIRATTALSTINTNANIIHLIIIWRKRWDSNPRAVSLRLSDFKSGAFYPLSHVSKFGAIRETRTPNLLITNQLHSQLCYDGKISYSNSVKDSNLATLPFQFKHYQKPTLSTMLQYIT